MYVQTRALAVNIASFLDKHHITAGVYHAGLLVSQRDLVKKDWMDDKIRIMVATNAFGMGIDKTNVRFVLHTSPPNCLESYYQEAGRDGKNAYVVLLHDKDDKLRLSKELAANDISEKVKMVYNAICKCRRIDIGTGKGFSRELAIAPLAQITKLSESGCH